MKNEAGNQLDLKLLERSLGRVEKTASAWMRDAGISAVLIFLFQVAVFLPAVDLFEEQKNLDQAASPLRNTQKTLNKLNELTTEIGNVLEQGEKAIDRLLDQAPLELRRDILSLDDEMREYRLQHNRQALLDSTPEPANQNQFPGTPEFPTADPGSTFMPPDPSQFPPPVTGSAITPPDPSQFPVLAPSHQPRFLVGVDADNLMMLVDPEMNPPEYRNLVQKIVATKIVDPHFKSLNQRKRERLDKPLAKIEKQLVEFSNSKEVDQFGKDAGFFQTHFDAMIGSMARLRSIQLAPPTGNPDWWRTFAGKGEAAESNRINIDQVVDESQDSLGQMKKFMRNAGLSYERILEEIKQETAKLAAKLSEVEQRYEDVRKLIGELGKPLSFITVKLDHALSGFPTAFLLLCSWLLWRLGRLRTHGAALYLEFKRHSASDNALNATIPDLARPKIWGKIRGRWLLFSISALLILLAIYDVLSLRNSSAFPDATGLMLLFASALLLLQISYSTAHSRKYIDQRGQT